MLLSVFSQLLTTDGLIGLVTLVLMEIVLGIDNIIFIAILTGYLPKREDQRKARTIGLSLALMIRIALLFCISWLVTMTAPLFTIPTPESFSFYFAPSGRDLILIGGGIFLLIKTVKEIHAKLKVDEHNHHPKEKTLSLTQAILQISFIDIIFYFDSILTAVALSRHIVIMVTAVTLSMFVMLFFARYVSDFINKYPTIKMLALAFLVLIGLLLLLDGFHIHIEKNYAYVAVGFSLIVELLNIRLRKIKHQAN
jgi:predicted tellurium resistance membrane protein TerC